MLHIHICSFKKKFKLGHLLAPQTLAKKCTFNFLTYKMSYTH